MTVARLTCCLLLLLGLSLPAQAETLAKQHHSDRSFHWQP